MPRRRATNAPAVTRDLTPPRQAGRLPQETAQNFEDPMTDNVLTEA